MKNREQMSNKILNERPKEDEVCSEKTEEQMKRYEERKSLIITPDDELIAKSTEGRPENKQFDQRVTRLAIGELQHPERKEFFKKFLKGKDIFDIGCGEEGFANALNMKGHRGYLWKGALPYIDFGTRKHYCVDPYITKEKAEKLSKESLNNNVLNNNIEKVKDSIIFVQKDGLSFLLEKENESGNSIVGNLNTALDLPIEYLQRITQEIFRTTPEDGILIVCESDVIEEEAKKLFPYHQEYGSGVEAFSKSPLSSDKELYEEYLKREEEKLAEAMRLTAIDWAVGKYFTQLRNTGKYTEQSRKKYMTDEELLDSSADNIFEQLVESHRHREPKLNDAELKEKYAKRYPKEDVKKLIKEFLEKQ